jgi:hypothetical protein
MPGWLLSAGRDGCGCRERYAEGDRGVQGSFCSRGFGAEDLCYWLAGCHPGWDRGERGHCQYDPGGGGEQPSGWWRGHPCSTSIELSAPILLSCGAAMTIWQ